MGKAAGRWRAAIAVALGIAGLGLGGVSRAQSTARLATSPGDGAIAVDLDPYGAFGYQTFGGGSGSLGDAMYDPIGAVGPSSTSWESAVYFRLPGQSTFLTVGVVGFGVTSGSLPDPGFAFQDGTTAVSLFTHAGLDWQLTQSVRDLIVSGSRAGTMLLQEYRIANNGGATVAFDLVRYYEGDLFLGLGAGVPDGGGHLIVGPEELVFETDLAGEPAATTNLIGITACGGVTPLRGRYEVNRWPAFPDRIASDVPLADIVFQDGLDPDEFVDAGLDYDVGIALANEFSLDPGQATVYLTTTVFGSLPPDDVSEGCAALLPPLADAGPDLFACPGEDIALDGSGSRDSDIVDGGFTETWTWDLDVAADSGGNGVPDDDVDAIGPSVWAAFPPGLTVVKLTYTDDDGVAAVDFVTVNAVDMTPPALACPSEVIAPATSFAGGPASPRATATDACDPAPVITNDRTAGGADATDDYPCGGTAVTWTATDAPGNVSACVTLVRIVPDPSSSVVGGALRVSKLPTELPLLDWSLVGAVPPEVRFTVLRGEVRAMPSAAAPTGSALDAVTWDEPDPSGVLVFYNVRTRLCDGSLSVD